jgi:hypothetical protein
MHQLFRNQWIKKLELTESLKVIQKESQSSKTSESTQSVKIIEKKGAELLGNVQWRLGFTFIKNNNEKKE